MRLERAEIAWLIPHAGAMCLLDFVESWDEGSIRCLTTTHRSAGNPLRRDGRLGVLCGVEYASQAMAVHAALTGRGSEAPRRGYLASLRGVSVHADRLDLVADALVVEAECLYRDADRAMYRFGLREMDRCLIEGRAAVVLEAVPG